MWNWIKSWFVQSSTEPFDIYHPKERTIFHYWNGEKVIDADPLPLYKKMMEVGPELKVDLQVSNSQLKDAPIAHDKAIGKIRKIFTLKSFDEGGLTEVETIALLEHFLIFCEYKKKGGNQPPTSQTETSPPTPPSSDGSQAMENTSPSGSTENGQCTEEQKLLPTE